MKAVNPNNRPWIDECYLSRLPRYDPELFTVIKMSNHTAKLKFKTAFCLLLFLNQVANHFINDGTAWDKIAIEVKPDGANILTISVRSVAAHNRLDIRFVPS